MFSRSLTREFNEVKTTSIIEEFSDIFDDEIYRALFVRVIDNHD